MDKNPAARIGGAVAKGAKKSLGTIWFLLKIMVPTSLVVALLGWSGLLSHMARFLAPLMKLIGLPGEAALDFICAELLNNYSAIAVMGSLSLSMRDATILALMSLTAHNLIVETSVMKSAGSSAAKMVALRLGMAIVIALGLNLLLPDSLRQVVFSVGLTAGEHSFLGMLADWGLSSLRSVVKVSLFVLIIMIVQGLLEEFKVIDLRSKIMAPFMKVFGLPEKASFLWIVINIVGYAYGAGIIKSEYDRGGFKKQEGDLFNHHAAISHSLLEDSILYAGIGIGLFWLIVPRLAVATIVVWIERFRRNHFKKSFRVGTV